ncbi:hypothetical protein NXV81_03435 [Bacteroides ovatus]|nr:hypothetical protein [Bacteroides ovatus]
MCTDDVVDKDPDDGDEPGGGGGEAPDPVPLDRKCSWQLNP